MESFKLEIDESVIPQAAQAAGIPEELVRDITREQLALWLAGKNLSRCVRAVVAGYRLFRSIDGNEVAKREVTLVSIENTGVYDPHYHESSDAVFIVVDGEAIFLSDAGERRIKAGEVIAIPRGMLHGFRLETGRTLTWISIQHPPIYSPDSGEDIHFSEVPLKGLV